MMLLGKFLLFVAVIAIFLIVSFVIFAGVFIASLAFYNLALMILIHGILYVASLIATGIQAISSIEFNKRKAEREAIKAREYLLEQCRERDRIEEQERRERLRKNPRPVIVRKFKDPAVTRLYMMFQDCFPVGGGFTCHGDWVDEKLTAKAREVLEPCFEGEPNLKPLSTKIVKLIHADAGDPRLSVEERTRMFQLFYEPNIQIRKSTPRQEEAICL